MTKAREFNPRGSQNIGGSQNMRRYVLTSCIVRESISVGSASSVLGQRSALPFFGFTAIPSVGKLVSPPVSCQGEKS